jgi:hypothetical protein
MPKAIWKICLVPRPLEGFFNVSRECEASLMKPNITPFAPADQIGLWRIYMGAFLCITIFLAKVLNLQMLYQSAYNKGFAYQTLPMV